MRSSHYSESVQCAFLIDQGADVSIGIYQWGVIYSMNPLYRSDDFSMASIHGIKGAPDFSIRPLAINESTLTVVGASAGGEPGIGPVHRGKFVFELHMWAVSGVSSLRLATDRAVDVRFCFGGAEQLSITDPEQLVKPWKTDGGTEFPWPDSPK